MAWLVAQLAKQTKQTALEQPSGVECKDLLLAGLETACTIMI
jgi:hypothetical protein